MGGGSVSFRRCALLAGGALFLLLMGFGVREAENGQVGCTNDASMWVFGASGICAWFALLSGVSAWRRRRRRRALPRSEGPL